MEGRRRSGEAQERGDSQPHIAARLGIRWRLARPPCRTWQPWGPSPGSLPRHWRLRGSSPRPPHTAIPSPKPYPSCHRRRLRSFLPGPRSSSSSTPTPASSPRWIAAAAVPFCRFLSPRRFFNLGRLRSQFRPASFQ